MRFHASRHYLHYFQPRFLFLIRVCIFAAFYFFIGGVTLLRMVEGVPSAVSCEPVSLWAMLDCFASCLSLLSSGIFLQATVPRPMRRAGFCIVILVCECAVGSLVTEQERAGNKITVYFHIKSPVIHWFHWHFKDHFDSHRNTGQSASLLRSIQDA